MGIRKVLKNNKIHSLLFVCLLLSLLFCAGCQQGISVQEQAQAQNICPQIADEDDLLKLVFIDVGQGDSILLIAPNGQAMLIDGGENCAADTVLAVLAAEEIEELAVVVATHPHSDHIGGLLAVFAQTKVQSVYMPQVSHDTAAFENLLMAIKTEGLQITWAKAGDMVALDDSLKIEIESPFLEEHSNLNNYSVVLHIVYGQRSFLLMGDAEAEIELNLAGINADVLKVGHHGSRSSTIDLFASRLGAQTAIISCGKDNHYEHPHAETLETLTKYDIEVYRTDLDGTITVLCDGKKITVEAEK